MHCDVTALASVQESVRLTLEQFGRIDIAIANAGVLGRGGTLPHSHPTKWAMSCPSTSPESSTRSGTAVNPARWSTRVLGILSGENYSGGLDAFFGTARVGGARKHPLACG